MKKRILSIVLCLFLLLGLTACGEGDFELVERTFDTKVATSVLTEGEIIAQNSKYAMEYAADTGSVRLVDLASGTRWDICPKSSGEVQYDDFGMPVKDHVFIQSAIEVGYMDPTIRGGGNYSTTSCEGVVEGGRTVVKKIENGVTVEYYFDGEKFMIPVDYVLKDDYLSVSIDSTKIQEEKLRVTYVSLAPFLSSVENDSENSYLFLPSGSGALLNVKSYDEQGIKYSGYVYGDDLSMEDKYNPSERQEMRMPVYGYKNGNKGGFVIIDNGAETALMNSVVGSTTYKFSAIYPSFQLRGYTNHRARTFKQTYFANVYTKNMIKGTFSLRFYPLNGENAGYDKMADIYRDYLINENGLTKTGDEKAMNLNIIGGAQITKSFLGIPYKTVFATTTAKQAGSIITEISDKVDNFSVKLQGFGSTGVDIGKIGGGYTISNKIGSASNLKELASLCGEKKVDLYFDYDLVRFNSSGNGFSRGSDAVMNSGILKAEKFIADKANRCNDETQAYRLLRPINFTDAVSKAISQNSKIQISGVSFDTLTSSSYADYSEPKSTLDYNSRLGFASAVTAALKQVKEGGQKLMATDANDYAAIMADLVDGTPVVSDSGYAFEEDVPFYSMVFKGYVPMTSESINLSIEPQRIILGAVEGGVGLSYTVINQWDNTLIDSVYPYFFGTVYSGVKADMLSTYEGLADYYASIKDAKIVSNTIISAGVHCTLFDNGVTVYVNYNSSAASTPAGECGAQSYIITGGAA